MNKNILKYIGVLLAGILLGWLIFGNNSAKQNGNEGEEGGTIYVCSMHPNIKSTDPKATCPLCGMDLTPMGDTGGSAIDENAVMFSQEAAALAGIETMEVSSGMANSEIRVFGKVQPSTRMQQTQSAYVAGRIEQLMVAAVGDKVRKGQTLATIYSPAPPSIRPSSMPSRRNSVRPSRTKAHNARCSWRQPKRNFVCSMSPKRRFARSRRAASLRLTSS